MIYIEGKIKLTWFILLIVFAPFYEMDGEFIFWSSNCCLKLENQLNLRSEHSDRWYDFFASYQVIYAYTRASKIRKKIEYTGPLL